MCGVFFPLRSNFAASECVQSQAYWFNFHPLMVVTLFVRVYRLKSLQSSPASSVITCFQAFKTSARMKICVHFVVPRSITSVVFS